MSFNIFSAGQLQDTSVLHLCNPSTEEPMYADEAETLPLEIELYGKASKQHRTWLTSAMRRSEAEQKSKKKKSADELLVENAKFFATMTKAIRNFDMDGEPLNSKEAFEKLYADPRLLWINEQVAKHLGDDGAFLK